ncbi:MAG: hypothetical protein JKX69_05710 [Rhodobacteraceae bacterium]|nr:hypothetical protein [Paracoccaceae bacterium]
MDWAAIEQNWLSFTPQILARWPSMQDDRVEEIDGDRETFATYLCEVEALGAQDAEDEITEWLSGVEDGEDNSFTFDGDDEE